ncbi:MAG TPA: glycosyltransferase family 2 protein [Planctomycetota bacterium]|nr:glycosyltransferase family 2 protein [Planctomycetota bacterium]
MPPLALVVCPLPAGSIAARAADSLLARLPADPGACVFCPEPYQAPAAWARRHRVLPLAELPFERQAGAITAPIYLLDGGPGERALRRYRDQVPGVEVDAAQPLDVAAVRAAALAERGPVRPHAGGASVEAMVLAFRSRDYIAPCIESLLAQDWPGLAITVLDNASGDGTAEFVRQRFPGVTVLESASNRGFAAGHNLLFRRCRADYAALLNHDAVARRNWVSELVAAAEALPRGAVFGSKMLMRRCPTILNSTGIVMNQSGFAADRDIGTKDLDPAAAPQRVFAVSGGALLLRNSVLRELGGFDPTFFMYMEDVDLCWRSRLAGHEVYHVPTAVVVHDWHGDLATDKTQAAAADAAVAEREGKRRFLVERNRLQSVIKNYSRSELWRVLGGLLRHDRGRIEALRQQAARGDGPLPARVLAAVRAARRWCLLHLPGLWLRRWRTQRLRRVPDCAFLDLIVPGFHEPSTVGDLHAIVDRYSARGSADIVMCVTDRGCLGPGWNHAEPAGDRQGGVRWSMAECWCYLQRPEPWRQVRVEIAPQPRDSWAELWVEGVQVGRLEVRQGVPQVLEFTLAEAVADGRLVECSLRCGTFSPLREGLGNDARELGLRVARIRAA